MRVVTATALALGTIRVLAWATIHTCTRRRPTIRLAVEQVARGACAIYLRHVLHNVSHHSHLLHMARMTEYA